MICPVCKNSTTELDTCDSCGLYRCHGCLNDGSCVKCDGRTMLRTWQLQSGFSVIELARMCGITSASMSQKLDGIRSISRFESDIIVRACHTARSNGMRIDRLARECMDQEPARYRAKEVNDE